MAHTILGIDLGTYAVKLAHLEAGFRTTRLLALHERELPPPDPVGEGEEPEPLLQRQLRTLRAMCSEHGLRPEMSAAALGEAANLRVVNLPLSDPKKLEQILPFELEGQLIGELEDHTVDYTMAQTGLSFEEGPAGQGVRVLAAAAQKQAVKELIDALGQAGLEPRLIGATALAGAAIVSQTAADRLGALPALVLDLGHQSCHVCVVLQQPARGVTAAFGRTIARGGLHLTQAIARALGVTPEVAQRLKHEADLGPGARTDPRVAAALREALRPLLRDLRQTLASFVSIYGEAPQQILLTGGGARLRGLPQVLAEELTLPASQLELPEALLGPIPPPALLPAAREAMQGCAAALGLALATAGPTPQVNFRRGELAYRTDYSFLREKAPQLALAALAIIVCAGLTSLAQLRSLQKEADQLEVSLRSETVQLFGEARTDGDAVSQELQSVIASARGSGPAIPTTSAFDLLDEISRSAPPSVAGKGGLDVTELNIRPKKTDIKGTASTASSAQYVENLAAALEKIPCFKKIEQGKVISVRNTGPDGKPVDAKQFSFNITTTCP